jgi:quercetin dioxygenase-like cupin family protein
MEPHAHNEDHLIAVERGAIELTIGDATRILPAGDTSAQAAAVRGGLVATVDETVVNGC